MANHRLRHLKLMSEHAMRYCECGNTILRREKRGGREQEYCSDACRQRASRKRNKGKHDLQKIIQASSERYWTTLNQHVHRETWQDELRQNDQVISALRNDLINYLEEIHDLRDEIQAIQEQRDQWKAEVLLYSDWLADRDAEIIRLQTLLDATGKW